MPIRGVSATRFDAPGGNGHLEKMQSLDRINRPTYGLASYRDPYNLSSADMKGGSRRKLWAL